MLGTRYLSKNLQDYHKTNNTLWQWNLNNH
jgi:hypothetical protein